MVTEWLKVAMLKDHVKQYFGETSLHGLKYITEDGRHPLERVLWVFLFFVGVSLAISFMHPSKNIPRFWYFIKRSSSDIKRYINDPTTTTLQTTDYPIWKIDFPGVTICPNMKVDFEKIISLNHSGISHFLHMFWWSTHLIQGFNFETDQILNMSSTTKTISNDIFRYQPADSERPWRAQSSLGRI